MAKGKERMNLATEILGDMKRQLARYRVALRNCRKITAAIASGKSPEIQ